MSSARKAWVSKYKNFNEVKIDLERKKLEFKDDLILEDEINEDNLECATRICYIEKDDGKEYYRCSITYYYLSDYKNSTVEELQVMLSDAKDELEELEEELEEIEDLEEDELEDYDFDSQEEYEEKLDDLDDDIYYLKRDIELMEKYLNEKKR